MFIRYHAVIREVYDEDYIRRACQKFYASKHYQEKSASRRGSSRRE